MAGYFTEYSGIRFGMFYMAEYINMMVVSLLVSILFLGGWRRSRSSRSGSAASHPSDGSTACCA